MSDKPEEDKPVEAVVPKPDETTPEPKVVPPVVTDTPKDDVRETVSRLEATVTELAETVSHIVREAAPDSTPVKKPWTHWGSK